MLCIITACQTYLIAYIWWCVSTHVSWWTDISLVIDSGSFEHFKHYSDVIMGAMGSQIAGITIDYSTVYSGADQIKHLSSASLAFVRGIYRWPVNSPHKGPVTRKMFPLDDIIMKLPHGHRRIWCRVAPYGIHPRLCLRFLNDIFKWIFLN